MKSLEDRHTSMAFINMTMGCGVLMKLPASATTPTAKYGSLSIRMVENNLFFFF